MKQIILGCAALVASMVAFGEAQAHSHGPAGCDTYTNRSGHHVCRPLHASHAPQGATAKCRNGSYSFSVHRSGTCSHHGGVAVWLH